MPEDALASENVRHFPILLALRSIAVHVVTFILVLLLGPTATLLCPFTRGEGVFWMGRAWSTIILAVAGVRLEVEGLEKIRQGRAHVLVGNHTSNFDIHAMILGLRDHCFRFTPKAEAKYLPIFGWALWAGRFPFIDRGTSVKAHRTMEKVARRIREEGLNVLFFPEGTRNARNEWMPFKKGPFVLAIQAGVPVVPFALHGARRVQGRHGFWVRPGVIRLEVLDPLPTEGLSYADRDALMAKARDAIVAAVGDEKARGIS